MSKKQNTAVEAVEEKNTAVALAFDMGDDAGAGMETADRDSFAIPFLSVLQKISPQVDEADAKYVEGAKGGQLFNSVTQKLYDGKQGVIFLPCAYQRRFIHWGARGSDGGGFKGEIMPEKAMAMLERGEVREIGGKLYFPEVDGSVNEKRSDYLSDTRNHFGILVDVETGETMNCLLSLTSTQIKKSKQLMSLLSAIKVKGSTGMVTPPTWANQVRITTVLESNDQGSWYGIRFAPEGFVESQELYNAGRDFHRMISDGELKANYAEAGEAAATEDKF